LPDDSRRFRHVADIGREIASRYGYEEIATPIFEFSEVFQRTLGETSDIVTKEMYTFTDKGGDTITLRPEGTAGVARAVISGGLSQQLPLKFFYYGPMFRYERPQKGRLRQFHQIGVELLGVAEPLGDVEVIALGAAILREIGILEQTTLELNTLGNSASRAAYRQRLVDYFARHRSALSEDSRDRLERNPLRILDSKDPRDREIVAGAPLFGDSLDRESTEYFKAVTSGLDVLGIRYALNPRLVRGLDYYCHTAFEFTTDALGAQGTVLAGGRYDGLIGMMGGPETPGVGWAAGVERLSMLLSSASPPPRPVAVIPVGEAAGGAAMRIAEDLRRAGFTVDLGYRGNLKRRLARANKVNARSALMVGDDELARNEVTLRDLDSGEQKTLPLADLAARLRALT
jgi:histidyl-tRNA synthetase